MYDWQSGLLIYFLMLLLILSYLSYSNSRVTLTLFREEGQSCARSAVAIIICTLLFIITYYPISYQLLSIPLDPHTILFSALNAYVVISPLAIFGVLFVPKVCLLV